MNKYSEGLWAIAVCSAFALLMWIAAKPVYPQIPDLQLIDIRSLEGGLNTRDGSGGIADNECTQIFNCFIDNRGISKRSGYTAYVATRIDGAAAGTGIFYTPFTTGATVVATAGTKVAYKNGSAWTDITGSVTLTADKVMQFAMANNNLVGCNGTNPAWYWSGTGNATTLSGSNIPTAPTSLAEYHGRLFLSQGRRLSWSKYMGDWTEFHSDAYQDFNEPIVGIRVLGEANNSILVVLCTKSIHYAAFDADMGSIIGGNGSFRFDHISYVHGCISPNSIQECVTPEGEIILIWADTDGLKLLSPSLKIMKITDKIDATWNALDFTQLQKSIGFHYKTKRWYGLVCQTNGHGTNDRVIIYDLRNWCISGIFDYQLDAVNALKTTGTDILVGSDNTGYWWQYDNGYTDNGTAINAYFKVKAFDGGIPLYDKRWVSVNLQHARFDADTLTVNTYMNYGQETNQFTFITDAGYAALGTFIMGTTWIGDETGDYDIAGTEITGSGQYCQLRIGSTTYNHPFKIYGIQLTYKPSRQVLSR